ncbi:MAG: bifunctional YncE family protein/alkaline phosphatase family protein [Bacteroidetes bacterium]|nr:bifunctional YncE family protein/alkaline phosphatase family protein [Bacteroidota bacterium]MBS1931692.1 bifunctional YncE family protein/alkaline phosphatase family protein [Bacteroidota bacterium]
MKRSLLVFCVFFGYYCFGQTLKELESKRVHLPNGWSLTPIGNTLSLGDLPLNMAVSASKKYLAVTNNGQSVQSLQLIDVKNERILDSVIIPKSWYGLKFSTDEKFLYASGGNDNWILQYAVTNNKLILKDSIQLGKKWPTKISPAGLDIDDAHHLLYVVTKENNSLYIVNLSDKIAEQALKLPAEAYTCLLSPDKKILYISCWGCDKILFFDIKQQKISIEIPVGDNPNELCQTKKGDYLFVSNGNDNSVSVINTKRKKVVETLNAALYPHSPQGSTPNGLSLSADEKTLYIANADNNCVAVFDISRPGFSKSKGFIPTGWYPTGVKVINKKLWVTNGKGFTSMANPYGPNPARKKEEVIYQGGDPNKPIDEQYIAGLFKGTMSIINEPVAKQLSVYSQAVYHNSPYSKGKEMISNGEAGNPVPMKVGGVSPIKYVFYIIKENRTYDQVLGDMQEGNGDTSLVLFGEKTTPNLHKIAKEFVLLDNFYCDGEVSADGHEWTMGAYATDYLEKTWPTSYGGRGGEYDSEGGRKIANNKVYLWDQCKQKNISYRSYGEFVDDDKTGIDVLKGHFSTTFTGWNLSVYDTTRFYQWKNEFDSLLKINAVPQFNTIRFPNDHTEGMRKGKLTPFAHAADNDLACGMFLDYLSKSSIWNESVVFIIEDDAQNGPDHVDAHRTTAYVAGGFVKRKFVDHTMYSTSSMLRTIELILGLDPMSQYDAAAEPMWRCFSNTADLTPYNFVSANVNLTDRNVAVNEWQRRSEKFNFAKEDAIPDMQFNEVLWYGIKGDHVPLPAPRRAAFFKMTKKIEDDD